MKLTEDAILAALSTVEEPDLKKYLVTLGMIRDLRFNGRTVNFSVMLTTPACPLKELIRLRCEEALFRDLGEDLEILIEMKSEVTSTRPQGPVLPGVKNIIAIGSGKGGVGKSTVTTNLAIALANKGAKVGLIDADIFGPSVPVMFNEEAARPGVMRINDKNVLIPIEKYGVKLLSIGFLASPEEAIVWRGPMASSALRQLIMDADWGELDYLLIDLPPGTSDVHLTLVQTVPLTGAVIVTTPQKVALADALKAMMMFKQKQINVPILGVVENMAYFTPEELPNNKYYLFGKDGGKTLARRYELPFLGEIPILQYIRESGDAGTPVSLSEGLGQNVFEAIAEEMARQVALRNAELAPTQVVNVK